MKTKIISIGQTRLTLKTYSKYITEMGLEAIKKANNIIIKAKQQSSKFEPFLAFCSFDQEYETVNVKQIGNRIEFTYWDNVKGTDKWVQNILSTTIVETMVSFVNRTFVKPIVQAIKSFVRPITFSDLVFNRNTQNGY